MNILLLLPPLPIILDPSESSEIGAGPQLTYPLGLGYLAAVLKNHGHKVSIIDLQLEQIKTRKEPVEIIDDCCGLSSMGKFDLIGITSITCTYPYARNLARIMKQSFGDVQVVLGGPHASFTPRESLEGTNVDFVIRGEGEYALLELVTAIEKKSSLAMVRGLSYKVAGEYRENPIVFIENLNELPFPDREALNHEEYLRWMKLTPLMSSRGCPIGCRFCSVSAMWGFKYRARSPENIMAEIEMMLHKYPNKNFIFYDDTFNLLPERTETICTLLIERKLDIKFSCNARADKLTKEVCEKLKEAGCYKLFVGVESGNPDILKLVNKKSSVETMERGIKNAQEVGMKVCASFIIGLPGEDREAVMETIKFAKHLKPDYVLFNSFTLFPGTEYYNDRRKYDIKIIEPDLTEYFGVVPVVETPQLGVRDRRELYIEAVMEFTETYQREHEELKKKIRNVNHGKST